ncbi:hypothetical protein TrRE_jg2000 [Triparma retinervis]|uniref:Uncharacterized protein n=1 Tax=Triparma retinervis TaxID=2557542 RepID=A0A9W7CHM1_9STRA|nr:hypothetical protein TrRE_jg2000 [Triparma retinervis]
MWLLLLLGLLGATLYSGTTREEELENLTGDDADRKQPGNNYPAPTPRPKVVTEVPPPRPPDPVVSEPIEPDSNPTLPDPPLSPRTVPPIPSTPPPAVHHGHANSALKTALLKRAVLWLDSSPSSDSISASPNSVAWSDANINMQPSKSDFVSIAPDKAISGGYSTIFSELVKNAVASDPTNPSNSLLQSLSLTDSAYIPNVLDSMVTFPAPLMTPKFSLPPQSTLFFVVTPEYLGGKTDNFQTFFTVGRNKFMFSHGKVAFLTKDNRDNDINSFLTGSKGHVQAGAKHLVAYKFNREAPSMSLNGSPFEHGSKHTKDNQAFASGAKAYVGGGGPTDGFVGKVEEVMVFNAELDDVEATEVMNHLAVKWEIEGMEDDIDLRSAAPLEAIGPDDDGAAQGGFADTDTIEAQIKMAEEKKREEDERVKNKFDPSNRSDKTKRLDEIHAKAIEESRMKSEEEVKKRKEEAQKDLGDVFDALYTVEKANKHVPGPCKNAGDSFKGVPLKVWEKGTDGKPRQVDWSPPPNADFDAISKWDDGHLKSEKAIKAYTGGGDGLKEVVRTQAKALQKLRHNLFCRKEERGGGGDF